LIIAAGVVMFGVAAGGQSCPAWRLLLCLSATNLSFGYTWGDADFKPTELAFSTSRPF